MQFIHLWMSLLMWIIMLVYTLYTYLYPLILPKQKILNLNTGAWAVSFLILLFLSYTPKVSYYRGFLAMIHTILSIMMLTWNSIFFDKHKEDIPENQKVLLLLNIALWSISSALMVTHFMSFTWIKKKTKRLPLHKGRASKL